MQTPTSGNDEHSVNAFENEVVNGGCRCSAIKLLRTRRDLLLFKDTQI